MWKILRVELELDVIDHLKCFSFAMWLDSQMVIMKKYFPLKYTSTLRNKFMGLKTNENISLITWFYAPFIHLSHDEW